jgi:hypothetical protein
MAVQPDDPASRFRAPAGADAAGTDRDGISLTFPDLPRLELDQLLVQLVERAQEVMTTQGRLRGLLHANQLIAGDLALPALLRRIAEAARDLVGARYAALGVIAPAGGPAEFVHVGMPADTVERVGHLPQGKGLLGALIEEPHPIRLRRISDDPRSSGFPPGHPPMTSFLGVPVRTRDEVFGNLYLAESSKGQFSAGVVGRVLFTDAAMPAAQPVRYVVDGEDVIFRAAAGTKLAGAAIHRLVVGFQADQIDPHTFTGWSVLGIGTASDVTDPDRQPALRQRTEPSSASPAAPRLIAISLKRLTGHRLP